MVVPPLVLERCTAGCLRAALDASVPELSATRLFALSGQVKLVVLAFARDNAAANTKLVHNVITSAPANVLILDSVCSVHRCYAIVSACLLHQGVLNPLFSLSNLMRLSDVWCSLVTHLANLVVQELVIVRVKPGDNRLATFLPVNRLLAEQTLLRQDLFTRARAHPAHAKAGASSAAHGSRKERAAVVDTLLGIANGPWLSPVVTHFCTGPACCANIQASRARFLEAVLRFMLQSLPPVPALNRWGTVAHNLRWWGAGLAVHGLLARAWVAMGEHKLGESALFDPQSAGLEDAAADSTPGDFHQQIGARLRNGAAWLGNEATIRKVLLTNVVLAPLDSFVQFTSSTSARDIAQGGRQRCY